MEGVHDADEYGLAFLGFPMMSRRTGSVFHAYLVVLPPLIGAKKRKE